MLPAATQRTHVRARSVREAEVREVLTFTAAEASTRLNELILKGKLLFQQLQQQRMQGGARAQAQEQAHARVQARLRACGRALARMWHLLALHRQDVFLELLVKVGSLEPGRSCIWLHVLGYGFVGCTQKGKPICMHLRPSCCCSPCCRRFSRHFNCCWLRPVPSSFKSHLKCCTSEVLHL